MLSIRRRGLKSYKLKSSIWSFVEHIFRGYGAALHEQASFSTNFLRQRLSDSKGRMLIRLGRLTPGYFRLLQLQVSGELAAEPKDRLVNHLALFFALMGLGLSYYSVRQMVQKSNLPPSK